MGKDRKFKGRYSFRHNPLDRQISEDRYAQPSSRNKIRGKESKHDEFVDHILSNKILNQARRQQEFCEYAARYMPKEDPCEHSGKVEELEELEIEFSNLESHSPTPSESEGDDEIPMMDKEDEKALDRFMIKDGVKIPTLADVIRDKLTEKLTEKKTEINAALTDPGSLCNEPIDIETLRRFKQLAPVLRDYRSGKLPKAFKAIPRFCNWEQIVEATEPEKWSAAAMYEATRIFSSNLQDRMAQRFYHLVLLPRLRDDIAESKKLNDHLYKALKKALFKPAAFFKGIVIPLCMAQNCTYREATIVGSVLAQFSVPMLHSSAALLTIAEMSYNGVESIFMRILLEKKYGLPLRVLNAVVKHFLSCAGDRREFPLLWHQCLLTFVQIYKGDLSPIQKRDLLKLVNIHNHKHVTPEIQNILMDKPEYEKLMDHLWKM